ncbi:MAG TPA: hypothetical protein PLN33_07800 [Hyphomonadaceae bacterium]|jgi:hypothetical protein|nr:hypothetical protein [Hyphomonadaceae bacterium]
MTLQYPLAPNARAALDSEVTARTIAEARELNKGPVELIADFVRPTPAEREEMQAKADRGIARGFVQLYEDAKGNPVIAVSYWKPSTGKPRAKPVPTPKPPAPAEDHTDDLYFNKPGAKEAAAAKKRKKLPDPNQLDLFGGDVPKPPKGKSDTPGNA